MKIKYKKSNELLTQCPHGVFCRVGSIECIEDCVYNEGVDPEKQEVNCSYDDREPWITTNKFIGTCKVSKEQREQAKKPSKPMTKKERARDIMENSDEYERLTFEGWEDFEEFIDEDLCKLKVINKKWNHNPFNNKVFYCKYRVFDTWHNEIIRLKEVKIDN